MCRPGILCLCSWCLNWTSIFCAVAWKSSLLNLDVREGSLSALWEESRSARWEILFITLHYIYIWSFSLFASFLVYILIGVLINAKSKVIVILFTNMTTWYKGVSATSFTTYLYHRFNFQNTRFCFFVLFNE